MSPSRGAGTFFFGKKLRRPLNRGPGTTEKPPLGCQDGAGGNPGPFVCACFSIGRGPSIDTSAKKFSQKIRPPPPPRWGGISFGSQNPKGKCRSGLPFGPGTLLSPAPGNAPPQRGPPMNFQAPQRWETSFRRPGCRGRGRASPDFGTAPRGFGGFSMPPFL